MPGADANTTLLDEEIKEARLEITHIESKTLVTVIEVPSPTNKIRGARGRDSFMEKRQEVLNSDATWVEIDLLRTGTPSPTLAPSDYRVLVSKAAERSRVRFWRIGIRQALPVVGIPLRGNDPDVPLDLAAVLRNVYDRAAYDLSLDYRRDPHRTRRRRRRLGPAIAAASSGGDERSPSLHGFVLLGRGSPMRPSRSLASSAARVLG